MKVIHISDIHVGYENLGDRFRTIIRHLIFEKGDKPDDYVVVISGDLVDDARDVARPDEVRSGLDSLREAGFQNILVVPGNHDYGTGSKGERRFVRTFKLCFYGEEIEYPKVDVIGRVAFLGLDSMAEELHWYDDLFAQGELGKDQLRRLDDALREPEVRECRKRVLYMHHHPFDAWPLHELKDSEALREVLSGVRADGISIDAILYGHNHEGKVHNGHWGIPRCYDAGTATLKPRPKWLSWMPWFEERASIRMINMDSDAPTYDYVLKLL